jgi:hypothetical protein
MRFEEIRICFLNIKIVLLAPDSTFAFQNVCLWKMPVRRKP